VVLGVWVVEWLGRGVRVSGLPLNKQRAKPSVAEAETETGAGTAIEMSQTNRLNKYFSNKHHINNNNNKK